MQKVNNLRQFLSAHASSIKEYNPSIRTHRLKGVSVAIRYKGLVLSEDLVRQMGTVKEGDYVKLKFDPTLGAGVIFMEFYKGLTVPGSLPVSANKKMGTNELTISTKSFIKQNLSVYIGHSIDKDSYIKFHSPDILAVALDEKAANDLSILLSSLNSSDDDDVSHPDFA